MFFYLISVWANDMRHPVARKVCDQSIQYLQGAMVFPVSYK
ncbi:MAG: hypothetical protein ACREAY_08570 [Nitrososphaera sp.]